MAYDTTTQTRPEVLTGAARWEALKLKHGVMAGARPAAPAVVDWLADLAEQAEKRDRYSEPSERYDDGYDVERWAGAGR